jgi:hypothetical protein
MSTMSGRGFTMTDEMHRQARIAGASRGWSTSEYVRYAVGKALSEDAEMSPIMSLMLGNVERPIQPSLVD